MLEVGRRRAHRRLPALLAQRSERLVVGGRGGRRGILRIEREEEQARAARRDHPADRRRGRGIAVTHRPVDQQLLVRQGAPERVRQLDALLAGDGAQRRFVPLPIPDRRVRPAAAGWPRGQDDQVQQRLPDQGVDIDHALVAQEFLQIAPHRPVVGGVRRAEVEQQHADPLRLHRRDVLRAAVRPIPQPHPDPGLAAATLPLHRLELASSREPPASAGPSNNGMGGRNGNCPG